MLVYQLQFGHGAVLIQPRNLQHTIADFAAKNEEQYIHAFKHCCVRLSHMVRAAGMTSTSVPPGDNQTIVFSAVLKHAQLAPDMKHHLRVS